ncbi:unnamed protein product [Candidula unifasciata]|uniref:Uncharacterized protein n=1 Tax=Candidula unifasciata TaxID=100452 RepID=A0A8S3ZAY7_9EUPU|nr:unnamed protein product [Candidula unifasciata]
MTIATYFWLCTMAMLGKLFADCPYQACICVSDFIECSARSPILTEIPALISTNTSGLTTLDFSANQITAIHSGQLPQKLTEMSFLENPITTIDDHAFDDSLTTLEKLSFSNCGITRIPTALYRLSSLKMLHIFNARITEWNTDVMKNIGPTVEELYLMNAGLSPNPDWLLYFERLKMLILDGCSIFSVPDDALHKVAKTLTHLSLANNNLTTIPSTIAELRSLQVLVLHRNFISDISSLPNSDQLVTLSLHNNNISDVHLLSDKLQSYNESLITVSLNNNFFVEFPHLDFLSQVGVLDLSHNQISNANSDLFRGL